MLVAGTAAALLIAWLARPAPDLARRVDRIGRHIEATLDGISDHQELQAGLRALVRMVRAEPS